MKRIAQYIALILLVCSCSDDYLAPDDSILPPDGRVVVNLSMSQTEIVKTRADEKAVKKLTMLVLDNGVLGQTTEYSGGDITQTGASISVPVTIDKSLRGSKNLSFIFVANSPLPTSSYVKGMTLADLKNLMADKVVVDGAMAMSGSVASLRDILNDEGVLVRNGAKVSVVRRASESDPTTPCVFDVFGQAVESSVLAGMDDSDPLLGDGVARPSLPSALSDSGVKYLHPTENKLSKNVFIIVRTDYEGHEYYYRADFTQRSKENNSEKETILDILPNHEYQVEIESVDGPGYATPAEAARNPSALLKYHIHDHAPVVFNMVSDGIRELGVSHQLVYRGNAGGTGVFYVKVYSPYPEEYNFADRLGETLSTGTDWMKISGCEEETGKDAGDAFPDPRQKGKVYKVTVEFLNTPNPGTLEGAVSVSWLGLSRDVPVKWVREFNGKELCSAVLTIDGNGAGKETVSDYWDFLSGSVYGIGAEANGGNVRNEGLHFPLMYGKDGDRWNYSYSLTFNDPAGGNPFEWKTSVRGEGMTGRVTATGTDGKSSGTHTGMGLTINVTRTTDDSDNTYSTGELVISVRPEGETEWHDLALTLYHTGFFHKENGAHRTDTGDAGTYYYEVVATESGYWLDRNLGAKSSALYIEDTDGSAYHGPAEAAGGLYKAAEYVKGAYAEAKVYSDLCPPGFEVPRETDWDAMRGSASFSTAQIGGYYTAHYDSPSGRRIYFPKTRYLIGGKKYGEARTGYYWSSTTARGLEKEEIGNWLNSLSIAGNSTYYIHARVEGKDPGEEYAMSVRCMRGGKDVAQSYHTEFFVSGATHVYLYTVDADGNRVGTTTWPGYPLSNHENADKWYSFTYDSKSHRSEELYVLFNYKDAAGQIHTMSKNVITGDCQVTTDGSVKPLGWKVVGDTDVCENGTPTQNGYWWKCRFGVPSIECLVQKPDIPVVEIYAKYTGSARFEYLMLYGIDASGKKYRISSQLELDWTDNIAVLRYPLYDNSLDEVYIYFGCIQWYSNAGKYNKLPCYIGKKTDSSGVTTFPAFPIQDWETTDIEGYKLVGETTVTDSPECITNVSHNGSWWYFEHAYKDDKIVVSDSDPGKRDCFIIHLNNEEGWAQPYVHYWRNGSNGSTWPGIRMTYDGNGIWSAEIPKMIFGKPNEFVIFHDANGVQTETINILGIDYDNNLYSNKITPPPTRTIYFDNTKGWTTPYFYYWGAPGSGWPGEAMEYDSSIGCWKAELPEAATGLIFNDAGKGAQTPDITGSNLSGHNKWDGDGNGL